jgi:CO dehydrogenase/acetyl-CoA synthase beta subunit
MPRVGLKPTKPVFERAKIFHALHSAATMIGIFEVVHLYYNEVDVVRIQTQDSGR